jgi:hypothetical protein
MPGEERQSFADQLRRCEPSYLARGRLIAVVVCCALTTIQCLDARSASGPTIHCPKVFSIASGNNQRGAPGSTLPASLEVNPTVPPSSESIFCHVLGATIQWSVQSGGGTIAPAADLLGRLTSAKWTLGPNPGSQTVRATWTDSGQDTAPSLVFTALAEGP